MDYSNYIRSKVLFGLFSFLFLALSACSTLHLKEKSANVYHISKELPKDSSVMALLTPYKAAVDSQMNTIIAVAATNIERQKPEGLLNNLVADAMASVARQEGIAFDFAHTNYGGLRNSIPAGPIKMAKVFELMPFENYLSVVKLDGKKVHEMFDYMAGLGGDAISGATFRIKGKKAVNIMINGKPLDSLKLYNVLTSDYMANGGDGAVFYLNPMERTDLKIKLRDVILDYLEERNSAGKEINPKMDGRITVE